MERRGRGRHGNEPALAPIWRSGRTSARGTSLGEIRPMLASRLRDRMPEIRAAVASRVFSISDPRDVSDPAYLLALNDALSSAIEYRLAVLEAGERQTPPVPPVLLAQARLEARDGVGLDTVLRRYVAGTNLFGDFVLEEVERAEIPSSSTTQSSATSSMTTIWG